MLDNSVPGFARIDDWPIPPTFPVEIIEWNRYRDGGLQGGTVFAVLEDAKAQQYSICFDKFLGRLCFGATNTEDENVAFVRADSALAHSIVAILIAFVNDNLHHREVKDIQMHIDLIHHWSISED